MIRDWETIKAILQLVEREQLEAKLTSINDTDQEFFGHLWLCIDAGFITGCELKDGYDGHWMWESTHPRLTMDGHDMLQALRSKTIWTAVKKKAEEGFIPITSSLIASVLKQISST